MQRRGVRPAVTCLAAVMYGLAVFFVAAEAKDDHDEDEYPPPVLESPATAVMTVPKLETHGFTSLSAYYAGIELCVILYPSMPSAHREGFV